MFWEIIWHKLLGNSCREGIEKKVSYAVIKLSLLNDFTKLLLLRTVTPCNHGIRISYILFCRFSCKLICSHQNGTFWKEQSASFFFPTSRSYFHRTFQGHLYRYATREKAKLSLIISFRGWQGWIKLQQIEVERKGIKGSASLTAKIKALMYGEGDCSMHLLHL